MGASPPYPYQGAALPGPCNGLNRRWPEFESVSGVWGPLAPAWMFVFA